MIYYVYAFFDMSCEYQAIFDDIIFTHKPVYIGKGKDNRMMQHFQDRKRFKSYFYNKLNSMISSDNYPSVVKLKEFDNEQDAIDLEINLIKFLRKIKDGGVLYNITDGGDGISGYKKSEIQKEKSRKFAIENKLHKYFPNNSGINHPFFGKKHKDSSIQKIVNSKLGTKQSKEWIEKRISKLRGIPLSEEHKDKLSKINKGKILSNETKQKISKSNIGKEPHNKGKVKDIILQLDLDQNIIREWDNLIDLSKNGFQKSNVINVCNGKRKSHRGYIWMYKSDYTNKLNVIIYN
jgi:hypothetical protein